MEIHAKTRKKRLHPSDWVILCLAAALLTGGVARVVLAKDRRGDAVPIVYTLLLSGASDDVANANGGWELLMPTGAAVTNQRGSLALGEVESIHVRPTLVPSVAEGEPLFLERAGCFDLYVRVRASALYRADDCYRVGDLPILCGTVGDFRIGRYLAVGCRIVRVERAVDV